MWSRTHQIYFLNEFRSDNMGATNSVIFSPCFLFLQYYFIIMYQYFFNNIIIIILFLTRSKNSFHFHLEIKIKAKAAFFFFFQWTILIFVCLSLMNEQAEQHILMTNRAQILASVNRSPTKQQPTSHSSRTKKWTKSYVK